MSRVGSIWVRASMWRSALARSLDCIAMVAASSRVTALKGRSGWRVRQLRGGLGHFAERGVAAGEFHGIRREFLFATVEELKVRDGSGVAGEGGVLRRAAPSAFAALDTSPAGAGAGGSRYMRARRRWGLGSTGRACGG